jgi:hypothetical protein
MRDARSENDGGEKIIKKQFLVAAPVKQSCADPGSKGIHSAVYSRSKKNDEHTRGGGAA